MQKFLLRQKILHVTPAKFRTDDVPVESSSRISHADGSPAREIAHGAMLVERIMEFTCRIIIDSAMSRARLVPYGAGGSSYRSGPESTGIIRRSEILRDRCAGRCSWHTRDRVRTDPSSLVRINLGSWFDDPSWNGSTSSAALGTTGLHATGTFLSGEILWESIMACDVDRDEPRHDIPVAGRGEAKTNVRKVVRLILSTSPDYEFCTSCSNFLPPK